MHLLLGLLMLIYPLLDCFVSFLSFKITFPLTGPLSWCMVSLPLSFFPFNHILLLFLFYLSCIIFSLFPLQVLNHHKLFMTIRFDMASCTNFMFQDLRKNLVQKLCDIFEGLHAPIFGCHRF